MADDSQRAKARATFGSSFFENSKAIPAPKNFASAQQKTANSRPIPTFKVGGAVKKADSGMPRNRPMPYDKMGAKLPRKADGGLPPVRQAAVMQRAMNDQGGSPMTGMGAPALKVMKKGGKIQTSADTARKLTKEMGGMNHGGRARMKPQQKNLGGVLKKLTGMGAIGSLLKGNAGKLGALGLAGAALGIGRKKKKPMMPPPQLAAAPGQIAGIGAALTPGMLPPPKDPMVMAQTSPMGMRPEDMVNPSETVTMQAKRGGKAGKYADGGVSERGKAFRAAYDRGDKEFTFNGKRFTTEMAKPSSSKLAAPSISVTRASVTMPAKRQENMSSTELSNLGAQRRAGMAKAVAGKSVSDSPGFDARPMKKADATGQTPAQMYRSMMADSRSMPKAKGNDDLYKLFVDNRGRDFVDKEKQMKMAARASVGRDLVRDANKMGSSDIGDMKRGGKAMKMAVGGAGKTRLGMSPIKRAQGGTATKSTLHPATSNKTGDRRDPEYGDYVLADKNAMKKLQGSSSAPVKKAQGGAAKVRRGMMTQSGQITPGVKPDKGIRAC